MDNSLNEQEMQEIRDLIVTKEIRKQQNLNSEALYNKIIQFIRQLPPTQDSLVLLKNLINYYGISILPFLLPFYQQFPTQLSYEFKTSLSVLAGVAKNVLNQAEIAELNFLFQYEIKPVKKKKTLPQGQPEFILKVSQLSGFNKNLKETQCSFQMIEAYRKFVAQFQQQHQNNFLYLKVIQGLALNQSELTRLFEKSTRIDIQKRQIENKTIFQTETTSVTQRKKMSEISEDIIEQSNSSTSPQKNHLCCRPSFVKEEPIRQIEGIRKSFMFFRHPFNNQEIRVIKETICSFLNSQGGTIYIGVKKNEKNVKVVAGHYFSQSQREEALKSFRKIAQTIEPDIITNKMYMVDFVPLREKKPPHTFVSGEYVVKVSVKYGHRDDIYSYKQAETDRFPFRNDNEIIYLEGRELLKNFRERIKNPLDIPVPIHEGPCQKPDLGQQSHIHTQKFVKADKPVHNVYNEKTQILVQQPPRISKQSAPCYFYITGLNEQQFSDLLKKKDLFDKVHINVMGSKELVVKTLKEEDLVVKLRTLFMKVIDKYGNKGVKINEITLVIKIENIRKAKEEMKKYHIDADAVHNQLWFKDKKDSLQAFLTLHVQGMNPEFLE